MAQNLTGEKIWRQGKNWIQLSTGQKIYLDMKVEEELAEVSE